MMIKEPGYLSRRILGLVEPIDEETWFLSQDRELCIELGDIIMWYELLKTGKPTIVFDDVSYVCARDIAGMLAKIKNREKSSPS